MTTSETDDSEPTQVSSELWDEIEADVKSIFGDDIDIRVDEFEGHVDVRIMPNEAVSEIEAAHDDLEIVPYNACKMTVRKEV